jgi:hypothetical protein
MSDNAMPLQFIYLTLPDTVEPVLNVRIAGTDELHRFRLTRRQLLRLNAETADAAMRGEPQ